MNISFTRSELLVVEKALETHMNALIDSESVEGSVREHHLDCIHEIEVKIKLAHLRAEKLKRLKA